MQANQEAKARETCVRVNNSLQYCQFGTSQPLEFFLDVVRPGQDLDYAVRAAGFVVPGVHFEGELTLNGEFRQTHDVWDLPKDKILVVPSVQRHLVAQSNPGQTILGYQHLSQVLDFASRIPAPVEREVVVVRQDLDYAVRAAGFVVPGVHFEGEVTKYGEIRQTGDVFDLPKDKILVVPIEQRDLVAYFNPGQTILGYQYLSQVLDFVSRITEPVE